MRNLTVFEGCDCTGKTTAARRYAEETGARYFPLGPLKGFEQIAHVYLNAMEIAISGRGDVVMDRSWISEPIYGRVFRGGMDRIGLRGAKALHEIATSFTKAIFVYCEPPWANVETTFKSRHEAEMLDNVDQLREVYAAFNRRLITADYDTKIIYDYTRDSATELSQAIERVRNHRYV